MLLALLGWWAKPRALFNDSLSPVLFSADGRLLGARLAADEQWRFPRLKAVPQRFFQALLQYEDRRFYRHRGVDLRATARALWANARKGRVVSGGSTLTMQVVRLARKNPRRTYLEKIIEMFLALRLELSSSKKEILDLHAANAPFGGNIVGIDAAAWLYFNRGPEALSWAEAAFLAVLPNDPKLIAGASRRRQLKAKRDRLLRRLRQKKFFRPWSAPWPQAESLPPGARAVPRLAPHLLDTLAARSGQRRLFSSFIRPGLQETLNRIVQANGERLLRGNIRNLAALVVDNRQGAVVAYVGNVSRAGAEHGQDVDLVRCPRSTGSILKPFLYAAMLQEGGLTPATLLADTPVHFAGYVPENFDRRFRGAVPARDALAWSLNIPAIRMLQQFGIPRFYNLLKKWGLSTLSRPPGGYGLTLVLGGAEGTLFDITRLYAGLAQLALGDAVPRREIRLLQDEPARRSRMSDLGPAAAYLTLDALTEVNRPDQEGFWKQFSLVQVGGLEDRHELRIARCLGGGRDPGVHGRHLGGQCRRRRQPRPDRIVHRGPGAVRGPAGAGHGWGHPRPAPVAEGDPCLPRFGLPGRRTLPGRLRGHAPRKPFSAGVSLSPVGAPGCQATLPGRFQLRVATAHGTRAVVRPAAGAGVLLPAQPS